MKVEWSEPAIRAVAELRAYIARDSYAYADAVVHRLLSGILRLEEFPRSGRPVPEADDESIREIIVAPYRIIYRIRGEALTLVTVIHGARDLTAGAPKPWEL